jgi:hypothetical protein
MSLKSASNYGITFGDNGGETMRINTSTNNVGIGTTSPETGVKLDVRGVVQAKDSYFNAGLGNTKGYNFHDFGTGWGLKGPQNPSRIALFTDTAERLTVSSGGNVGIGTTTPSFKLDVAGTGNFTGLVSGITPVAAANFATKSYVDAQIGANDSLEEVTSVGNSTSYGIRFASTNFTIDEAKIGLLSNNIFYARGGSAGLMLQNGDGTVSHQLSTNTHVFETSSAERMRITSAGFVGMGTTSPEAKLTIKGDALNTNQPVRITNSVTDTHTGLFLNNTGSTVGEKYGMQFGGYNQYSIGGIFGVLDSTSGSTSGDITFDLGNGTSSGALVERMRITHEGNFGIGTTSPAAKLDVFSAASFRADVATGNPLISIVNNTATS